MNRSASRLVLAIAVVCAVALGACSSDDDAADDDGTSADSSALSVEADPDWGDLAGCAIGPQSESPDGTPATEGVDGVLAFGTQVQEHVDGCVDSPVRPAVGGEHHGDWANCGFYRSAVPEEAAVHVLEHGGVWIAFDPSIPAAELAAIEAAATSTTHILANPYPGLRDKVVMTAWSRQLTLDSTTDARFQEFIDTYLQGPDTPELGAPCSGGIGTPDSAPTE